MAHVDFQHKRRVAETSGRADGLGEGGLGEFGERVGVARRLSTIQRAAAADRIQAETAGRVANVGIHHQAHEAVERLERFSHCWRRVADQPDNGKLAEIGRLAVVQGQRLVAAERLGRPHQADVGLERDPTVGVIEQDGIDASAVQQGGAVHSLADRQVDQATGMAGPKRWGRGCARALLVTQGQIIDARRHVHRRRGD